MYIYFSLSKLDRYNDFWGGGVEWGSNTTFFFFPYFFFFPCIYQV